MQMQVRKKIDTGKIQCQMTTGVPALSATTATIKDHLRLQCDFQLQNSTVTMIN